MKRFNFYSLIVMVMLTFCLVMSSSAMAKSQTLKAVSFLPKDHPLCKMIHVWVDRVNAECGDAIKVNWLGGGEVIPGFDQAESLQNNIVQIIFNPTAYYAPLAPELNAFTLSKLSIAEERKPGGLYEYMDARHKKIGMKYIGTWLHDPFYLRVNKPVKTLEDLKGIKMRTSALYDRFMKKLGMVPVTVKFGDTFTSLERNLVQGFGFATLGPRDWGWLKNCKYIIDIPFYTRQNVLILMNLEVWQGLEKTIQDKIMDITTKFEPEMVAHFKEQIKKEWEKYDEMGIKRIKFSPAENKKYYEAAYEAEWEDLAKKVPALVPDLKRLTGN
jgi:TRAP-type transport system periplasmic protein